VWCTCKANVSDLDENVAALCVWLNASKSDDLRTNAFSRIETFESQWKKYLFYLLVNIVTTLQKVRINVYFFLICESSPYVLSYRSIYSQVNTVSNFSNVLVEILFTNSWRQYVAKLSIPELSLRNSVAFLSSAKASQRFAWKSNFLTCTRASLNYTLSFSEYMTTNVKA